MSLGIDKNWIFRNFVRKNDPVILQKVNDIKGLSMRDIIDAELKIAKDGNSIKLIVRDGNHVWSTTLTKEK